MRLLLLPLLTGLATPAAAYELEFQLFPWGTTTVMDTSADGNRLLLYGQSQAWSWTQATGLVSLGPVVGGGSTGLSADGQVAVGIIWDNGVQQAATHTSAGWQPLSSQPAQCDSNSTSAYGTNGDGSIVVGLHWQGCSAQAARWDAGGGVTLLAQDGPISSRANAVSDDGGLIGGWDEATVGYRRAAVWLADGTEIVIGPNTPGEIWAVSGDGKYAVGELGGEAIRWSLTGGIEPLGMLPGTLVSRARAASEDGSVIIGDSQTYAFLWTETGGLVDLTNMVLAAGIVLPSGYRLDSAKALSEDGSVLGGSMDNGQFQYRAWSLAIDRTLEADVGTVSISGGTTQTLELDATADHAGETYFLTGSVTGSWPGLDVEGRHVPLNLDAYTLYTISAAGLPPLTNGVGVLDSSGRAQAGFKLPLGTDPSLAGVTFHHAFVTLDPAAGFGVTSASNAVPVVIQP